MQAGTEAFAPDLWGRQLQRDHFLSLNFITLSQIGPLWDVISLSLIQITHLQIRRIIKFRMRLLGNLLQLSVSR